MTATDVARCMREMIDDRPFGIDLVRNTVTIRFVSDDAGKLDVRARDLVVYRHTSEIVPLRLDGKTRMRRVHRVTAEDTESIKRYGMSVPLTLHVGQAISTVEVAVFHVSQMISSLAHPTTAARFYHDFLADMFDLVRSLDD